MRKQSGSSVALMLLCLCLAATIRVGASSYNPIDDFSISNGNPNGVWSYGWMTTSFTNFTHYTNAYMAWGGINPQWWGWNDASHTPSIWLNEGSVAYDGVAPGKMSLHPGDGHQPSVLRWTASVSGQYEIAGEFLPGDSGSMKIGIRQGPTWLWQGTNAGAFDISRSVAAGESIDFLVYGGYEYGNTPLDVTIGSPPPLITEFYDDGTLRWSNSTVGVYSGVQATWDLLDPVWCPFAAWDVATATETNAVDLGLDTNDWTAWSSYLGVSFPPAYFRIATHAGHLETNVWTNSVRLHNAAAEVLSNIVVSVLQGSTSQTNQWAELQPGQTSSPLLFTQPRDWFIDAGPRLELRAEYYKTGTLHQVDFVPTVLPCTQSVGN